MKVNTIFYFFQSFPILVIAKIAARHVNDVSVMPFWRGQLHPLVKTDRPYTLLPNYREQSDYEIKTSSNNNLLNPVVGPVTP